MSTELDLRQLALDRGSGAAASGAVPQRRWVARYAFPAAILLGFAALLGAAARHQLMPVPSVTVVPAVVKRAELQVAGTRLFQAPGWIEPRPTPVNVPALAAGVIEQMFVVEGERVTAGQPVAQLIDVDARLAVQQAEAALAIRQAERDRARAEHRAAQTRFDNPVHLEASLADAESTLAKIKTELDSLPRWIAKAEADAAFARTSLEGKRSAGAGIAALVLSRAEADDARAQASLEELRARQPNLVQQISALQRKTGALREQLRLRIEERRQLDEAEAKVKMAAAMCDEGRVVLEQAELALRRMVVRAPVAGRILRLVAAPGDRVMGLDVSGEQRSSTVVQMYDPDRLQVRADVRLEDVPLVEPGQPVEIETASSRGAFRGRVLLPTSTANIQKNTLEVKVELLDPPATITPEMLVTTTFLAPADALSGAEITNEARLFAPSAVIHGSSTGNVIWVVDHDGRAQARSVETGAQADGGLIEIVAGLNVTDKLIVTGVEGLASGTRVEIVGDDPRLGF